MQLWNLFTANRRLDCEKSIRALQDSRRSTDRFAPLREQQEVISMRKMVALVGDETRPGGGWPRAIAAAEHTFGSGPGGLGGVEVSRRWLSRDVDAPDRECTGGTR